jgi:predicted nucleic acid binding AN1-type Zn finger protein
MENRPSPFSASPLRSPSIIQCAECDKILKPLQIILGKCKCTKFYCNVHIIPEKHKCTHDYYVAHQMKLTSNMPIIKDKKLENKI